uniref:DUF5745 domain-containing protein n=1 Tax=Esox lucius TaxID=8010 RepID=A0A3P8XPY7_ESOLU
MGTQEERDWVDVANDILSKCHINLRLRKVADCDANVFVALYESILGEKVPDYIAAPGTQEDDVHNVQSVIDSLALDYLQISLSHITGENIVQGDKDSIKNLLEIFDGLLEYLTEQISEEGSQNEGRPKSLYFTVVPSQLDTPVTLRFFSYMLSFSSAIQSSSKHSLHSWNGEETGSTNELIRLGDSARTFTAKQEGRRDQKLVCPTRHRSVSPIYMFFPLCTFALLPRSPSFLHLSLSPRDGRAPEEGSDESLSWRRHRNRKAEQELHHMSEKLSRRLEELDMMLKRALGESGEAEEVKEEDKQSHHSDSVMECRRAQRRPTGTHTTILQASHLLLFSPPPVKVKENDLLPLLLEELPHLHISPHALGRMWHQQLGQVDRLNASLSLENRRAGQRPKLSSQVEEAQRRHDLLVEIIRKEQEHNRRLSEFKERIQQQKSTQNRLKEQRQQIARAKKYHSDYHVQLRARMMRARTKEEQTFKQVLEEGLEIQKGRLREQRAYAKEQRQEHQRKHRDQIQSMENYYKDQFSLLAETLAIERQDIQVRKKAQEKALQKMKRELRSKMEREIGELQKIIIQNDDDDYFRELEVQRLRSRVQMASFQYNTSCLH